MRLNQLSYLVAIEKYGTISQAAKAMYVSQPSISVAIRELEEELGYPLLTRSNKGIHFTEEGALVLERAHVILQEVEAIRYIQRETVELAGDLLVGGTPHFCTSFLLDVKLALEASYPRVRILAEEDDSERVLRRVANHEIQMGIIQLCDVNPELYRRIVTEEGVYSELLFEEVMCVAVGANHSLADRKTIQPEELLPYPYGTYKGAMNQQIRAFLKEYPERKIFTVNDIVPLRQMLIRRNGYTVIPQRSVAFGNQLYSSQLVPLLVEGMPLHSEIVLIYNRAGDSRLGRTVKKELLARSQEYLE